MQTSWHSRRADDRLNSAPSWAYFGTNASRNQGLKRPAKPLQNRYRIWQSGMMLGFAD
jgi:hypothetical protein